MKSRSARFPVACVMPVSSRAVCALDLAGHKTSRCEISNGQFFKSAVQFRITWIGGAAVSSAMLTRKRLPSGLGM